MKKIIISIILIILLISYLVLDYYNLIPKKIYYAEDFNIEVIKSDSDVNNNGIDDYTDILYGAKKDAISRPKYKSAYYAGGYPPDNEGVCTDLIWRAFKEAGYNLKEMVDQDIKNFPHLYPGLDKVPDPNIDFRRVVNLKVFFDRYATNYTTDIKEIKEWQPGDIVIIGEDYKHIGIISDKRNKKGTPYLLHNGGQYQREEDVLDRYAKSTSISAHYRFENN